MCHASTVSTNMTENLTTYLSKKYPRKVYKNAVIDMILNGKDNRIDITGVYPPLSTRESHFIETKRAEYANPKYSYDFSMTGSAKLPWVTGNMLSKLNDNHPYYLFAKELGREMIVGPSGTMEAMLNVSEIFNVNIELFSLGCIAWMFSVKDHSLYELMIIVNKFLKEPFFVFKKSAANPQINDLAQLQIFMNNALAAIQSGGGEDPQNVALSVNGIGITRSPRIPPPTTPLKAQPIPPNKRKTPPPPTPPTTPPLEAQTERSLNFEYTSPPLYAQTERVKPASNVQFPTNIGTQIISDPMHLFCAEQGNFAKDLNDIINHIAETNKTKKIQISLKELKEIATLTTRNLPKFVFESKSTSFTKKSDSKSMSVTRDVLPFTNTVAKFTPGTPAIYDDRKKETRESPQETPDFFNGLGVLA